MSNWTHYQVQSRYNPEQCPAASHDWTDEGSPRKSYPDALDRMHAWSKRSDYKDYRVVRMSCHVMEDEANA